MRDRGVEVVELHEMLAEVLARPEARTWLLDRKIVATEVGLGLVDETRSFLDGLDDRRWPSSSSAAWRPPTCPTTCGPGTSPWPGSLGGPGLPDAALPNTLYTRDTTCWIYGGVTLNPCTGRPATTRRC